MCRGERGEGAFEPAFEPARIHSRPSFGRHVTAVLLSAPTDGIDEAGTTFNARHWIRHSGQLVGRELRQLLQVAAVALRPLVEAKVLSEECWQVWSALGTFGRLLFQPSVAEADVEAYQVRSLAFDCADRADRARRRDPDVLPGGRVLLPAAYRHRKQVPRDRAPARARTAVLHRKPLSRRPVREV